MLPKRWPLLSGSPVPRLFPFARASDARAVPARCLRAYVKRNTHTHTFSFTVVAVTFGTTLMMMVMMIVNVAVGGGGGWCDYFYCCFNQSGK